MSNLIHCDGPACERTRNPDVPIDRRLGERAWVRVEDGPDGALDFHDVDCLGQWADAHGSVRRGAADPCTCHRAQTNPHSKAEHQAYPTVVDGL